MRPNENQDETAPAATGAASESEAVGKDITPETAPSVPDSGTLAKADHVVAANGNDETPAAPSDAEKPKRALDVGIGPVVIKMRLEELKSHPRNDEIYGADSVDDLVRSIKLKGSIETPLHVTRDGTIISGHRRYRAAKRLGIESVPVLVIDSTDSDENLASLHAGNVQRTKSNRQIAAECVLLMEIEKKRREATATTSGGTKGSNLPPVRPKGKARDAVSKETGLSPRTVDKAVQIIKATVQLRAEGKDAEAEAIDAATDKSFDAGHKLALAKGAIKPKKKTKGKVITKKVSADALAAEVEKPETTGPGGSEKIASEMSEDSIRTKRTANSDTAMTKLDEVLTFLRGLGEDDLTEQQRRDWKMLFDQLDDCRADLNL